MLAMRQNAILNGHLSLTDTPLEELRMFIVSLTYHQPIDVVEALTENHKDC